jgi:3-oxoacid CoA-transferase subunit A
MSSKLFQNSKAALYDFFDGARIMVGGFGLSGIPENLIRALAQSGKKNLTIISNNCGNQGRGLAVLLKNRQVDTVICSYVGGNPDLEEQMLDGSVKVELNPQGTLAERIRAGGAGIGAFFTPTGYGTEIAEGKDVQHFNGKPMILETALHADFALIRAHTVDTIGNCRFHGTSINFSPAMAMAGAVTIVDAEHIVQRGTLKAEDIHLPSVFIQRIVHGEYYDNFIEYRTTKEKSS